MKQKKTGEAPKEHKQPWQENAGAHRRAGHVQDDMVLAPRTPHR